MKIGFEVENCVRFASISYVKRLAVLMYNDLVICKDSSGCLHYTLPLIPLICSATSIRQLGHHVVSTVECHLLHPDCCCIRVEMVGQGLF